MIVSERKYIINSIFSLIVVSFVYLSVLTFTRYTIMSGIDKFEYALTKVSPSGLCPAIDKNEEYIEKSEIRSSLSIHPWQDIEIANNIYEFFSRIHDYDSCIIEKNGVVSVWEKGIGIEDGRKYVRHLGWWGPDGFSADSATGLGNFPSDIKVVPLPIVQAFDENTENFRREAKYRLFDNVSKCLYILKLTENYISNTITGEVVVGPENPDIGQVLQIADSDFCIYGGIKGFADGAVFIPPQKKSAANELTDTTVSGLTYVIDNTGNIYQLNEENLKFDYFSGKLPAAPTKMLQYIATPLTQSHRHNWQNGYSSTTGQYAGLAVASCQLNGKVTLEIFDTEGKSVGSDIKHVFPAKDTTPDWYDNYMIPTEACYGISFHLLSYLMADAIPADEIMENMLAMPYSYAARTVLVADYGYAGLRMVLLLCLLNYVFFIYLLRRSFVRSGLPGGYFKYWAILIVLLGPMAYIAYQLTRPGIKQVTCPNCGQNRRPDQDNCLNCKAPWQLPHLEPVGWVIVGQASCLSPKLPEKLAKPFDSVET
ncbi:MAG: hypothetical protein JW745_04795 [Sedimentisphaerales bacterium]|nr:hypothetical protein [Sedimentisphaerales bacterium]MBN2844307.1 hypothetical protein [Sedimentisphaerales bacterium]